ncbi:MAG: hypothetical protein GC137_00640 [Alphaproteobacteria bacterium]|nr:hypothetical protein [Alphaproteobacteria bacterium]
MKQTERTKKETILGGDVNQALRELVRLSKRLIEFTDQETQNLITQDYMGFAFSLQEKENLAHRYTKASEEFRARLDEFKTADNGLILQLNKLQNELKDKAENNNRMINQIQKQARTNTTETLFAAQELGQRVTFPGDTERSGRRVEKLRRRQMQSEVRV